MKWAALVVWVVTALGGFGLLAIWLQRGGMRQADQPGRRIRPALIFSHFLLAATGLVLWIIFLASHKRGFAWAGFIALVPVAALGFTMLAFWLQRRQAPVPAAGVAGGEGSVPAEQHFPVPVVVLHGVLAASTLVLALLAALKVGGS